MSRDIGTMSEFYCVLCGRKGIPVWRRKGAERESGHLKKLWCLGCKTETNHVEIKPSTKYGYEQFKEEYEYENFTDDGDRIMPYNKLKEMIDNGKIDKKKIMADGRDSRLGQEYLDRES